MSVTLVSWRIWLLAVIFQHEILFPGVQSFAPHQCHHSLLPQIISSSSKSTSDSALFATKKKKKKGKKGGGGNGMTIGGFGGAAMETCPCGSGMTYSSCCSKVHKNVQSFRGATAEQIVRARYSAYSRKLPEFLMMSTHPNNVAFNPDLRAWKESIKVNMYDKFDMNNCVILEEKYGDGNEEESNSESEVETATVKFIAEMVLKKTGEKTSFMETSKFEKAKNSGSWLYLSGEIEEAPSDDKKDDVDEESSDDGDSIEEKLASQL